MKDFFVPGKQCCRVVEEDMDWELVLVFVIDDMV